MIIKNYKSLGKSLLVIFFIITTPSYIVTIYALIEPYLAAERLHTVEYDLRPQIEDEYLLAQKSAASAGIDPQIDSKAHAALLRLRCVDWEIEQRKLWADEAPSEFIGIINNDLVWTKWALIISLCAGVSIAIFLLLTSKPAKSIRLK